jgi:hypothetical protein
VRQQIAGTVAVAADGSRANNVTAKLYNHYFVPSGQFGGQSIYLRTANVAYEVDDNTKTAIRRRCTCTWEEPPQPIADVGCLSAAKAHLGLDVEQTGVGQIAGALVIWYRKTDTRGKDEAAFAPKLGCDILEQRSATYNGIGLPTSRFHSVIRSYLPANPDQNAFAPPAGYALKESPDSLRSAAPSRVNALTAEADFHRGEGVAFLHKPTFTPLMEKRVRFVIETDWLLRALTTAS